LKQKREYKGGRTKKVVQKNNEANKEQRTRNKGQIREDKELGRMENIEQ
jgi:hypothetical protein